MYIIEGKSKTFKFTGYFSRLDAMGNAVWNLAYDDRVRLYKTEVEAGKTIKTIVANPHINFADMQCSAVPIPDQLLHDPNFKHISPKDMKVAVESFKQIVRKAFTVEPHNDIEVDVRSIHLKADKPFSINHVRELHGLEMVDDPMYEELL